ncbi:nitroreductase family protein [Nocardia terpenica]|uniref:Nitroreductase n=2 Tax=Nocardia terpenica TaxID=455432 RepID=A0A291RGT4_9NOCA|nr:nitroreductase family protein [Nocardia terpenica]ATL66518.1 nitroreductase [Nocardia terpenica]
MTDLDLLTTTRAFRRRLDPSAPVSRRDIEACLDIAVHAPSGSNRQPWHFVLIDDPETRSTIADYYRRGFAHNLSGRTPDPDQLSDLASARHLAEHLHTIPLLILVCTHGRPPATAPQLASFYASVYPAVWNLLLALHAHGYGSCLTTAHLAHEHDIATLLDIPYEKVTQIALLPVARLHPGRPTPPRRRPATQATSWNRWTTPSPTAPHQTAADTSHRDQRATP